MDIVLIVVGLLLILVGANYLTDGSAALAKRFNVSEFVVGLTIVAVGTSTPELIVSLLSSLSGNGTMAIGNVVGSNIFNTLVILGICAVVKPVVLTANNIKFDIPLGFLAALILILVTLGGEIPIYCSIAMALLYFAIMWYTIKSSKKKGDNSIEEENVKSLEKPTKFWLLAIMIVGGLAGLIFGGNMLLDGAVNLANRYGIPQNIIAIVLLAGGTSLPELAASVVSLAKGKSDMALGNVIGSNIANILLVLGLSGSFTPLALGSITTIDLLISLIGASLLFIFAYTFKKSEIDRIEGVIMLLIFAGYIYWLVG